MLPFDLASDAERPMPRSGQAMANNMALEKKIDLLVAKVDGLAADVGELKTKVTVGFEESHRLLKLSLEGLAGLEETTVDRFDKISAEHDKQFALLETFGVHVRKRVQKLENRPKTRRPV
jgi:thiamine monophosphate kinase